MTTATSTIIRACMFMGLFFSACAPTTAPEPTKAPPLPTVTSATTPQAAPPTATSKGLEEPRYGGIVTRVTDGDVPSFDLQREQAGTASAPLFNIYQGLVRIHPVDHTVVPELGEKWEISPDGKSYTFRFYKGIKWHDGKPFTMEDVKYSLERMQNPEAFKTISPRGKGLLARMDSAEIVGEDSIKITLKYPSAPFLRNLATGWVVIQPKDIMVAKGDMRRDAIGTGAFKLKNFTPDIGLALEKNPSYYIKGLPYLDGIQLFTIKDSATRFSAFRTGKVKITYLGTGNLTPTEAEMVRNEMADKAVVYQHDAQSRHSITFNLQRKPWDDLRVRKAADLAFDRQAAIKVNAVGYIGSIYVTPWGMKAEDLGKLPGYRQPKGADIAEAKKLMAEAGFPNGFKTTLLARPGGAKEQQAVVAKDQLAKIGIEAELVLVDQATLLERCGRGAFDLVAYNWLDDTGDPDETLNLYYATGGSRNFGAFSDKALDELVTKQALTMDAEARKAILAEIEKKIMDEAPMVIAFWDIQQTGAWKEVKNFRPGAGMHPWGKFDLMWLAK